MAPIASMQFLWIEGQGENDPKRTFPRTLEILHYWPEAEPLCYLAASLCSV